jgi:hypothetical protein
MSRVRAIPSLRRGVREGGYINASIHPMTKVVGFLEAKS